MVFFQAAKKKQTFQKKAFWFCASDFFRIKQNIIHSNTPESRTNFRVFINFIQSEWEQIPWECAEDGIPSVAVQ